MRGHLAASVFLLAVVAALRLGTGPAAAWLVERLSAGAEHHCHCPLSEHHCSCPLCSDAFETGGGKGEGALEQGACTEPRSVHVVASRTVALLLGTAVVPSPVHRPRRPPRPFTPDRWKSRSVEPETPPPRIA